jgi:phosphoglycolate phosphatase-like HAD superfamily hydrolase
VLRQIHLLVFDLDYLIYDCAHMKLQALRQSLISFADAIPQSIRLPDAADIEEDYRAHGFRWSRFLEIGLDEEQSADLRQAYQIHERRLVESGPGRLYPGISDFVAHCRLLGITPAVGADASREYLLAVSDRHALGGLFEILLCAEEFGVGGIEEMLEELMHLAEVNPSETLVLGTRPAFFHAAHNLDILTIGCGWGVRRKDGLQEADLQALSLPQLPPAVEKADELAAQYFS